VLRQANAHVLSRAWPPFVLQNLPLIHHHLRFVENPSHDCKSHDHGVFDMSSVSGAPGAPARRVGLLLGIGIFLLPVIFSWFLLRRGYSVMARVIAFGWMILAVVAALLSHGSGSSSTAQSTGGPQPATAQADFDRVNANVVAAVQPCERGWTTVQPALKSGNVQDGYNIATTAKTACMTAWTGVNSVKFGDATPQPYRDKLNNDLNECSHAYLTKATALNGIAEVLNGDSKPSKVQQVQREIASANEKTTSCLAAYVGDAKASGVTMPGSKDAKDAKGHKTG
jgi:hypothetical protein